MSKKTQTKYKIVPKMPRDGGPALNIEVTKVTHPPKETRRYVYWTGGRS